MSNRVLEETFTGRFREYEYLWQAGEYYGAAKRLAELSHCVSGLNADARNDWSERIKFFASSMLKERSWALEDGLVGDAERIRRILSIGSRWNGEEILLVLGMRIEIDLMLSFLREHRPHHASPPLPLEYIDERLIELGKSKEHGPHFRWAIEMMKKNWGLPIDSRWLRLPAI
jgi:hypothetical protein